MKNPFIAKAEVFIKVKTHRVWEALTQPTLIKEYLFGTEVVSDWKVGSPLVYRGVWEGQTYEDKGIIKELVPQKSLVSTYWSSFTGLEDTPENYQTVSYTLQEEEGGGTRLLVTQDNVPSQESALHSEENWRGVLEKMKGMLEG